MFHLRRHLLWVLLLVGAGTAPTLAQEATEPPEPPRACSDCHLDTVTAWQDSPHAQSSTSAGFLQHWTEAGEDSTCLSCHTTGFVPFTGDYSHEGVACAACHGDTPAEHPPEPVNMAVDVATCATCHETTYAEWAVSAHGEQQLACTTCHAPHAQTLRFETADALCLNCHTEDRDDFAHVTHVEQQCVDCHWYRSEGAHQPTGHDNVVETSTCIDCHASEQSPVTLTSDTMPSLRAATVRITELETEVQSARAASDNNAALQTVYGVIIGAVVVAGVGMVGGALFRSRKRRSERDRDE